MTLLKKISGIYAITDPILISDKQLYDKVSLAIDGGISVLQYRNKFADEKLKKEQAYVLNKLCQQHQVTFIINDDVTLAKEVDADGVHIGAEDLAITHARAILGEYKIIGVSCYNQLDRAIQAQLSGADYIALGRFFPSNTKPQAIQADLSIIQHVKQHIQLPIVAIGGINSSNASLLINAGVDALAVIEGIFGQEDIKAASQQLSNLFHTKQ